MKRVPVAVALSALASAHSLLPVEHDYTHSLWRRSAIPERDHVVTVRMYLQHSDIERAADYLDAISDPKSASFGQHLSRVEAERLFMPSRDSIDAVLQWMNQSDIPATFLPSAVSSGLLRFKAEVSQLESVLDVSCTSFTHDTSGERHVSCPGVRIPSCLLDHVEHMTINDAPYTTPDKVPAQPASKESLRRKFPRALQNSTSPLASCATAWSPACIRDLYEIPVGHQVAPNNSIGIYGYADLYAQSDLDSFFKKYAPEIPQGTHPINVTINGGYQAYTIGEENLDLQMSYPIVYPQDVTLFQVDGLGALQTPGFGNHFLDAVDKNYCHKDGGDDPNYDGVLYNSTFGVVPADCGTAKVTNVVSISYAVDEITLDTHYIRRQCNEWMKLALQGITVLVASGDRGVGGAQYCGNPVPGTGYYGFIPSFPAVCPYVTAVGATQVNFTANGTSWEEVAVDDYPHKFWSGGGFSNVSVRRAWQDDAVKGYFAMGQGKYPRGTYNRNGRAYPDVAMLGALVSIFDQGEDVVSGGTSASTPLFASMINRINDIRLLAGKKSIGFLNPILYQHPEVFRDITKGHNPGCLAPGFNATVGWDPVSGMGAPVYPKLRDLLVSLP